MKKIFFFVLISIMIVSGLLATMRETYASTASIQGFAWSSNIGWISFSGSNYGVVIDESSGVLSGYAWSSHVGWISFNIVDLAGCNENPCSARYSSETGEFSGWARATAADGVSWSGFIHLSGDTYGLSQSNGDITGYAWGHDVIGWIMPYNMTVDLTDTCSDGIDNDFDDYSDSEDIDCGVLVPPNVYNAPMEEVIPNSYCHNGHDDDYDGFTDFGSDPECPSLEFGSEDDMTGMPIVALTVGINTPTFDSITLGKGGGRVTLGIDIGNGYPTTSCGLYLNGSFASTIDIGGAASYQVNQQITVNERTRAEVRCVNGVHNASDGVTILIRSENEF